MSPDPLLAGGVWARDYPPTGQMMRIIWELTEEGGPVVGNLITSENESPVILVSKKLFLAE